MGSHSANKLEEVGFRRELATLVSFYHDEKDVNLVVHGDDYTFTGDDARLRWRNSRVCVTRCKYARGWALATRTRCCVGLCDGRREGVRARRIRSTESQLEAFGLEENSNNLATPVTKNADRDDYSVLKV